MKNLIRCRFLPVFLCMVMAMSLTACGGKDTPPVKTETGGAAGILSVSKEEKDSGACVTSGSRRETAWVDPDLVEESLELLYDGIAFDDQYAGAVGLHGIQRTGGRHAAVPLAGGELCRIGRGDAVSVAYTGRTYPRAGYGDLFCIVPRDETTMLTVERITWVLSQYEVGPVTDEVFYQTKST